jgi:D-aminoacyl-tRNA deacylase
MRIIIQRVLEGKVTVGDNTVGSIGKGLMILVGLSPKDSEEVAYRYAEKVLNLRLWDEIVSDQEPAGKSPRRWHSNLVQNNYGLLVVSQFTLYAKMKGNKPDFHGAMDGDQAKILFDKFVAKLRSAYASDRVKTGAFGEYMNVHIINDGPVTIFWDSEKDDAGDEPVPKKEIPTGKPEKQKKEVQKAEKSKPKLTEAVICEKGGNDDTSVTTQVEPAPPAKAAS